MAKMPEITVKLIDVERLALAMEKVDAAVRRVQAAGGRPGFEGWTGYATLIAAEYVGDWRAPDRTAHFPFRNDGIPTTLLCDCGWHREGATALDWWQHVEDRVLLATNG